MKLANKSNFEKVDAARILLNGYTDLRNKEFSEIKEALSGFHVFPPRAT